MEGRLGRGGQRLHAAPAVLQHVADGVRADGVGLGRRGIRLAEEAETGHRRSVRPRQPSGDLRGFTFNLRRLDEEDLLDVHGALAQLWFDQCATMAGR